MITKVSYKDCKKEVRVAFYNRLGSEYENQYSMQKTIEQRHNDLLQKHCNWLVVYKYCDIGFSGTKTKNRPSLTKLIQLAEKGMFNLLVVKNICGIARNTTMVLEFVDMLKQYGVEVYFVDENIWTFSNDSEVIVSLKDEWTSGISQRLSEKINFGQEMSRRNGVLYGNGNILGYKREGKTYVIQPEEAETVQIIYNLYLQGYSLQKICNELMQEDRKCSNGQVSWVSSKIARILSNTTYKGVLSYKNSDLHIQCNFPPIISAEDWDKVQSIRETKKIR